MLFFAPHTKISVGSFVSVLVSRSRLIQHTTAGRGGKELGRERENIIKGILKKILKEVNTLYIQFVNTNLNHFFVFHSTSSSHKPKAITVE